MNLKEILCDLRALCGEILLSILFILSDSSPCSKCRADQVNLHHVRVASDLQRRPGTDDNGFPMLDELLFEKSPIQ